MSLVCVNFVTVSRCNGHRLKGKVRKISVLAAKVQVQLKITSHEVIFQVEAIKYNCI